LAQSSRSRFFGAAILIVDSQILPAIKSTEALAVHTRYVTLFYCVKVTSRHHVMMRGEWSVIHLRGLLTKPAT
jgi:hypothetical protein